MRTRRSKAASAVKKDENVISAFDFLDMVEKDEAAETEEGARPSRRRDRRRRGRRSSPAVQPESGPARQSRGIFVTGTDTGVGKTFVSCVLGILLKNRGLDIGVMKPVQCGGDDTAILMKVLNIRDGEKDVNPYRAKAELSPHVAFPAERLEVKPEVIAEKYRELSRRHDLTIVEGAGGLMVPLKDGYLVADLIRDLGLDLVIVARPGLGTLNHTLLTVRQARLMGITVAGVVLNQVSPAPEGEAEKTNPEAVRRIGQVPVLGSVPFMEKAAPPQLRETVQKMGRQLIDIHTFLSKQAAKSPADLPGGANQRRGGRPTPWVQWDKKYLWHPFTQMKDWLETEPLVIDRARGAYLEDTEGRRYIDGVSSLWVNVHGHGHRMIDEALQEQVGRLSHSTLLGLSNTPAIELARKLAGLAPRGLEKVFFSDNGSTAVEIAIKMAYQYWQNTGHPAKTRIAHLSNSYHGDTLGSVSVGGIDLFHKVYGSITFPTLALEFPDFYRAPEGKAYPQYTEECLSRMEEVFRQSGGEIAALVIEPLVQGAAGMIVWPQGVLRRIGELCRRYNVFLIADEVATGFGRTGKMFACEHEHVTPDFLCLAKGLTGGYLPLAATLTTQKVFDGFLFDYDAQKTFFHGHTYTGNPLCCAAALASLRVFEQQQVLRRLGPKVQFLEKALCRFRDLPAVGDIRQKGFMAGIELVRDREGKTPFDWNERAGMKVCERALAQGVILRPLGNVIVLMPPLSISRREMDQLLGAAYDAIAGFGRDAGLSGSFGDQGAPAADTEGTNDERADG